MGRGQFLEGVGRPIVEGVLFMCGGDAAFCEIILTTCYSKYCDQRLCMSVCLYVCPVVYLKGEMSKLHDTFCSLHVNCGRGSVLL